MGWEVGGGFYLSVHKLGHTVSTNSSRTQPVLKLESLLNPDTETENEWF